MSKMRLLFFIMIVVLSMLSIVQAQTKEIKDYTVVKGDTLWDISGKELGDPFLWPKIWQENPDIANPDRLYPGQSLKIPLYLVQKEMNEEQKEKPETKQQKIVAEVKAEPSGVKLQPLINKNLLAASGYIADSVKGVGMIAGSPTERIMYGNDDIVYVKTDRPVKIGDRFYIVRVGELVRHPVTNKKMGYLVEMLGVAEILRFEYGDILAKITQMFNDIHSGDLLETFYEISPPLTTGIYRKPDINGYVVASKSGHLGNAKFNVVYIDRGLRDGLDIGDIVKTLGIVGEHKVPNGSIQIINCQDTTSTALVLNNYYSPILVGNLITHLE